MVFRPVAYGLVLTVSLFAFACESKKPDPENSAPEPLTPEETAKILEDTKNAQSVRDRSMEIRLTRIRQDAQRRILQRLGEVKDWTVSTVRDGKVDDALVAAENKGEYDALIQEALRDGRLKLHFFLRLPLIIKALRNLDVQPESVDITAVVPMPFAEVERRVGSEDSKESETGPDGKEIEWKRYGEVSFGVVGDDVVALRIHVSEEVEDWQDIGKKP